MERTTAATNCIAVSSQLKSQHNMAHCATNVLRRCTLLCIYYAAFCFAGIIRCMHVKLYTLYFYSIIIQLPIRIHA